MPEIYHLHLARTIEKLITHVPLGELKKIRKNEKKNSLEMSFVLIVWGIHRARGGNAKGSFNSGLLYQRELFSFSPPSRIRNGLENQVNSPSRDRPDETVGSSRVFETGFTAFRSDFTRYSCNISREVYVEH